MGIIKKQSIASTVYSYLGVLIGFANVLFIQPRLLDSVDIGLLRLLLSVSSIVAMVMPFGIGSITMRFFPVFKDEKSSHHGHFSMMFLFTVIGGVLITSLLYLLKPQIIAFYIEKSPLIPQYFDFIWFFAFTLGLIAIYGIFSASLYRSGFTFFLNDVLVRLLSILIVVLYYYDVFNRDGLVISFISIYVIQFLLLVIHLYKLGVISLKIDWEFYRSTAWKSMLTYGWVMLLTAIASLGIKFVDQIILGHYLSLSMVGIYSICIFIVAVMEIPYNSMERITNAKMAEVWHKGDKDEVFSIYKDSVKYLSIISVLIFGLIWTQAENIFRVLPEEFGIGLWPMRIIAFSSLINSITGLNGSVLTTSHKYFVGAFLLVILLVSAVLLNWVLIPIYGLNGAALATCLAVIFFNLLKYFYILYRYKMQPFDLKIFVIITFGLVVTFITTLIPSMTNIWLDLIIRGLLMVVPYCLFLLYLQPVKEIVKLNSIIRTKILRR